jgi:hypothetical protein
LDEDVDANDSTMGVEPENEHLRRDHRLALELNRLTELDERESVVRESNSVDFIA